MRAKDRFDSPTRIAVRTDRLYGAPGARRPARRYCAPISLLSGPAVIASIAYMDPGNFATNIQAGAKYGYTLLWVVLARQSDRDAVPGAFGQARHRHRAQPRRDVPRPVSAGRSSGRCGWSARSRPWRPISPSSSAAPSACRCCSTCRSSPAWSSPRSSPTAS